MHCTHYHAYLNQACHCPSHSKGFFLLTPCSSDIVDIKPANMEELTEVITAAEFHPHQCNTFVYSSSKGTIRLCDMRVSALCDKHSKCKHLFLVTFNHYSSTSAGGLSTGFIKLSPSIFIELHFISYYTFLENRRVSHFQTIKDAHAAER